MMARVLERVRQRAAVEVADWVLSLKPLRRYALARGDAALHDFYCVKRFEGLPLGVQEFRYRAITNLLHEMERAVSDGRISRRARQGLLRVFVANLVMNARRNVAPFIAEHGFEPPAFVVVSPTQKCNLFCSGCYAASSSRATATLSYEVFRRILAEKRDRWGSYFTVISGGEPLLYESQGKRLLDVFEEFIDHNLAERLAQLANVTVAISVEGFERETDARRGSGTYRRIGRAMQSLRELGVPFGVSFTATRENADTLLSEEIIRHYFDEQGALYAWMFHYMPIGRSYTVDMMVTAEQRSRMLTRQLELIRNRGLFFIDFWNGGPMSGGCLAAGRPGGYFHVDWNGDISPCVFMPYAVDNVHEMYRQKRDLTSVLNHPAFQALRAWQTSYAGRDGRGPTHNLFTPCPLRDHHDEGREILVRFGARPIHEDAARALRDEEYRRRMVEYGKELSALLDPVWEREVGERGPEPGAVATLRPAAGAGHGHGLRPPVR